jgi:hypothetical protein
MPDFYEEGQSLYIRLSGCKDADEQANMLAASLKAFYTMGKHANCDYEDLAVIHGLQAELVRVTSEYQKQIEKG